HGTKLRGLGLYLKMFLGWLYKLGRVVLGLRPPFLAMAELKRAWLCAFGLSKRFCKISGLKT
ncbi:MAG: hypothetical protein MR709_07750, partial [Bacteroidales bacterium]|nr:hypothetical protein [Bacteroidales bacterium]